MHTVWTKKLDASAALAGMTRQEMRLFLGVSAATYCEWYTKLREPRAHHVELIRNKTAWLERLVNPMYPLVEKWARQQRISKLKKQYAQNAHNQG